MITEGDILRQMIEFSEQPHFGPLEWARRQNIDSDALMMVIKQFSKALWNDLERASDEQLDDESGMRAGLEATVNSFLALFAVAFELGRQYPSTPFEG